MVTGAEREGPRGGGGPAAAGDDQALRVAVELGGVVGRPLERARGALQRRVRGIVAARRPGGAQHEGTQTGAELVAEGVVGGTGGARPTRVGEHDDDRRRRAERLARRPADPHGDRPASPPQPQVGGAADAGGGGRCDRATGDG